MSSKVILSFLLFILIQTAFSQDFQPGYIVKNGVKESGRLSFLPTKKDQSTLYFKASSENTLQSLPAGEVDSFYLEKSNASFKKVLKDSTWIFSEVIVVGPVTLLSHKSYFTLQLDSSEISINTKKTTKTAANAQSLRMGEIVQVGKIKNFLKDYPDIQMKRVNSQTIEDVTESFNQHKTGEKNLIKKKGRIVMGVVAGLNIATIDQLDYGLDYYTDIKVGPSIAPRVGLSFDFVPRKYLKKTALSADIIHFQLHFKGDGVFSNGSSITRSNVDIQSGVVSVPISLKVFQKYNRKGLFFNPGFTSNYFYKNESYQSRKTTLIVNDALIGQGEEINSVYIKKLRLGLFLGVGYNTTLFSNTKLALSLRGEYNALTYQTFYNHTKLLNVSLDGRFYF